MSTDPDRDALDCAARRREAEANPPPPGVYECRCDHPHPPDATWCYLCEYPIRHGDHGSDGVSAWVLIKGWHDSGNIQAVYGPYSRERAQWLWNAFLAGNSTDNWTLVELQDLPPADPPGAP